MFFKVLTLSLVILHFPTSFAQNAGPGIPVMSCNEAQKALGKAKFDSIVLGIPAMAQDVVAYFRSEQPSVFDSLGKQKASAQRQVDLACRDRQSQDIVIPVAASEQDKPDAQDLASLSREFEKESAAIELSRDPASVPAK